MIKLMLVYFIVQTVALPWEWPQATSGTLRLLPRLRNRCGRSLLPADSGREGERERL